MITSDQCLKRFGDPNKEKNMILYDVPTRLEIGVIPKRVYCNKLLVEPLETAFENLIRTGCVRELKTWDGLFNIRNKKGGSTWSLHAFGLACDVNAAWNQMGKTPTLSVGFVKCFLDAGFDWGGYWDNPDGMHFQLKQFPEYRELEEQQTIDIAQLTDGSVWRHKGGNVYRVKLLTNNTLKIDDPDYPITVVYENVSNKTMWSRPVSKWFDSMQKIS